MDSSPLLSPSAEVSPLTVRQLLELPQFETAEVLAGNGGLDRRLASVNVMENPDILPWVKAEALLITVGYSLRDGDTDLEELVQALHDRNLAAFGVKLGRYITQVSPEVLALAEELDFPLLALPTTISFDDMIGAVYRALNANSRTGRHEPSKLDRELIDLALAGGSPSDVAECFSATVDCEIAVLGRSGEVLVSCAPDSHLPVERNFDSADAFDDAVSAPIVAGSSYVGQIYAFPNNSPNNGYSNTPNDGERSIKLSGQVSACAQFMALAASREIAVAAVDRQFHSELMTKVLHCRLDAHELERRCRGIEWNLEFPCRVITILATSQTGSESGTDVEHVEALVALWLRGRSTKAPMAVVDGAVVVILASGQEASESIKAELTSQVLSERHASPWSAGISNSVEDLTGLERAWGQAALAAKVGAAVTGVGHVELFRGIGAYRLLSEIDPKVLAEFARDTLGSLLDDANGKADLLETLGVLLRTNLNVAETARQLHYHYNTVRYRMVQLEKLVGPFQSDPARCLEMQLALLIRDMPTVGHGVVTPQ